MLSLFIVPWIVGCLYWLLHKLKGKLEDPRSKYRRMRLFGGVVLLFLILWIASVLYLSASVPGAASRGGRSLMWIGISTSVAWRWIRLTWTPFDQWTSENEDPDTLEARGPIDAFRLWFKKLRKWLHIEKPALKPYQYSQESPSQKTSKSKDSTPLDPMEEELLRYQDLLSRGVITNQEYDEMRRKTLGL